MMDEDARPAILPTHIEETIAAIARLHSEHHKRATPLQRFTENLTARAGQSTFIAWLLAGIVVWVGINLLVLLSGKVPLDAPPFPWLQDLISLAALFMAVLILSTQRRDDELATLREQLTLELAILSEQKSAKIIELIEELRRDHPSIPDRVDRQAEEMAAPADPNTVLEATQKTHQKMIDRDSAT
jgi:uncharacterized membrane protein